MAKKSALTTDHKAALAEGRSQSRAVRGYLEALDAHRPKRGRKRTPESMQARIDKIAQDIDTADPLKKLGLVQERLDLQREIDTAETKVDLAALEAEFIDAAKAYSTRKGISYTAWRELGVQASTLKNAGITRSTN